jgi:hypothetical protein
LASLIGQIFFFSLALPLTATCFINGVPVGVRKAEMIGQVGGNASLNADNFEAVIALSQFVVGEGEKFRNGVCRIQGFRLVGVRKLNSHEVKSGWVIGGQMVKERGSRSFRLVKQLFAQCALYSLESMSKTFFLVFITNEDFKIRAFVPCQPFQPRLTFLSKASLP